MNVAGPPYCQTMTSVRLVVSPRSHERRRAALDWMSALPGQEILVLGETLVGPHDLLLEGILGGGAAIGWRRMTLDLLASELALAGLGSRIPGGTVARDAVVTRTIMRLGPEKLGRLGPVVDTPGFGRAVGSAIDELRMAGAPLDRLADRDRGLSVLAAEVEREWEAAGLVDRAAKIEAATATVKDAGADHPVLDHPTLLYDLRIGTGAEAAFVAALIERAPRALVTVPAGDATTLEAIGRVTTRTGGGEGPAARNDGDGSGEEPRESALRRLQDGLFGSPSPEAPPDDSLTVFSAPGESRECVEIARRLLELAEAGTGFDRAAVLLRQPADYRPHLEEALRRADIPAWYARGVRRPDPAGRAFLALLRCREENYSALRFAEFLSIGEVPEPPATDEEQDDHGPVRAGTVRRPRRWEKLLVESSVVGGLDRWERRLDSLREELEMKRDGLEVEDVDHPRVARISDSLADLESFRDYALPLLSALADLPESGTWAEWIEALDALADRSIRRPDSVRATLAALAPLGPVGPVTLPEVLRTLGPRLLEVTRRPEGNRYGRVFVGAIEEARGLTFDVVFIPGMAERVFPPKISEDPILLDDVRDALNAEIDGPGLPTNPDRVSAERTALAIGVGSAREQVVLSYPRIESGKSRPRVPSFYMLEAVRAGEGTLPRFEDLAKRAEDVSDARIGWPAPRDATRAIDEAEYDLAVLAHLGKRGDAAVKAAGHLLNTNPHLARALRFRAYRWEVKGWTWADGLLQLSDGASAALARHAPDARPYSATALQHFAACPYRFYLYTILGLSPREEPVGIESLDPLQRGSLVHQVQFELLTRLQKGRDEAGEPMLPVTPENLSAARDVLDEVLDKVAADFEDRLVPAIDRVWTDGIESIRLDLRQWLHRVSIDPSPFEPYRFELSFGLPRDRDRDEHSVADPVDLGVGIRLRGAIDLVERTPAGVLRVTDHKTGRYKPKRDAVIQGGELLQPVLYGLAAQQIFPDHPVQSGRLYYCTSDGEFRAHEVPINEETTKAAEVLADVLGSAFSGGAFAALPRTRACEWCDYRTVCGPDEERRIQRKPAPVELKRLREYQ